MMMMMMMMMMSTVITLLTHRYCPVVIRLLSCCFFCVMFSTTELICTLIYPCVYGTFQIYGICGVYCYGEYVQRVIYVHKSA